MKLSFTQEDLIRFLYGECSPNENKLIQEALVHDWDLKEAYLELVSTKDLLDSVQYTPAQTSVDLILKHNASTVEESSASV